MLEILKIYYLLENRERESRFWITQAMEISVVVRFGG